MNTNNRRPEGWASADAAGLAILAGLIRFDEVYNANLPDIRHAFRVTVRATDGYVYPASHRAGSRTGALPMGARLRLKASVDVTRRTSDLNVQRIFRAMQKHGLIVADNGSDLFITGTYDVRWNNELLNPAFSNLTANDFEVIQLGYNPPPSRVVGSVHNLRAMLLGKTVRLQWDQEPSLSKYRIQVAPQLTINPSWQTITETSATGWDGQVNSGSAAQFYRVLLIAQ